MQAQTFNDGAAEAITNTFSVGRSTTQACPAVCLAHKKKMEAIYEGMPR